LNRYKPIRELGKGSYGVVWEGVSLWENEVTGIRKGTKVAIKKVRRVWKTEIDAKRLLRELRILRCLANHQCIVKLYDILPPLDPTDFPSITLVFEFVDADFSKIFTTNQYFTPLHCQYMLYHILLGIKYMHSGCIYHRDLKPANLLINADCSVKICDFGLARGFNEDSSQYDKSENDNNNGDQKNGDQKNDDNKNDESKNNNQIDNNKNKKKIPLRALTTHVVTRWYRAPEVILLNQKREYLTAVDMWSVGCFFAELLQMQKGNCAMCARSPLFPGDSCFPLSPKRSAKKQQIYQSPFDQIRLIFDVLGKPSEEEINKLEDKQAQQYMRDLPDKDPQDFTKKFPVATPDAIDLLTRMLTFDVEQRINVEDALNHPYFSRVRDKTLEKFSPKIKFEFEDVGLDAELLKSLILHEILHYNPMEKERFTKSGALQTDDK